MSDAVPFLEASGDASHDVVGDGLPTTPSDGCSWCRGPKAAGATFCGRKCRQAAFRFRKALERSRPSIGDGFARAESDASPRWTGDGALPSPGDDTSNVVVKRDTAARDIEIAGTYDGLLPGAGDAVRAARGDASFEYLSDGPLEVVRYRGDGVCPWCGKPKGGSRRDRVYCSPTCKQISWRRAQHNAELERLARPMTFAYFDPPYPDRAYRYRDQPEYAGELDHEALIREMRTTFEHWALSTSAAALHKILPLLPKETRICPWVKPNHPHVKSYGLHHSWEPLLVFGGRQLRPGRRDWLLTASARLGGSNLVGRKPLAFYAFLFGAMGARAGDTFIDKFPGSRMGERAFAELCRASSRDTR